MSIFAMMEIMKSPEFRAFHYFSSARNERYTWLSNLELQDTLHNKPQLSPTILKLHQRNTTEEPEPCSSLHQTPLPIINFLRLPLARCLIPIYSDNFQPQPPTASPPSQPHPQHHRISTPPASPLKINSFSETAPVSRHNRLLV